MLHALGMTKAPAAGQPLLRRALRRVRGAQQGECWALWARAISLMSAAYRGTQYILINMGPQALGMTKPPATKQLFLRRMLRRVEARGEEVLGIARVDRELGDPNWHLLRRLTALDTSLGLSRYISRLSGSTLGPMPRADELQRQTALQMNRTAMVREKRSRLLLAIRQTYQVRGVGVLGDV